MNILSLDLSTNTGYSLINLDDELKLSMLVSYGILHSDPDVDIKYPFNYVARADKIATLVSKTIDRCIRLGYKPDIVVIEETNSSRSRYTQKLLEFIHYAVVKMLASKDKIKVKYINTSDWRKMLGVVLSAEDRKQNAKLSKAKSEAKKAGLKLDKKKLGIRGRINKKHVAIKVVNSIFNLDFKPKDNDLADAICLGVAYIKGVKTCDGK